MKITLKSWRGLPIDDATAQVWAERAVRAIHDDTYLGIDSYHVMSGNRMVLALWSDDSEDIEVFDMTINRYAKVSTGV